MKFLFFVIGLLFECHICFSQKETFSLNLGLNGSFETNKHQSSDQNFFYSKSYFQEIGIEYERKLHRRLFFSTGFSYSPKGYDIGPLFSQRNGVFGYDYKYYEKKVFRFFELPIGLKFVFFKRKKSDFAIEGGGVNQLLYEVLYKPYNISNGNPVIVTYTSEPAHLPTEQFLKYHDLKTAGFRIYNVASYCNVEFRYKVGKMFLSISPGFKYSFFAVTKSQMISYYQLPNEHLYSYGVTLKIISGSNKN